MTSVPVAGTGKAATAKKDEPVARRLIEDWLPIAALGEESIRERRSMTALPPTYYLHVWWARRPLVACRAALSAAMLPDHADRDRFMRVIGIHGDPVAGRRRIDQAAKDKDPDTGRRFNLGANPYGYDRAFTYRPTSEDLRWVAGEFGASRASVLDPTAGGGSVPFEAARLGLQAVSNDLNPVAWLLERATVEFPNGFGPVLTRRVRELGAQFMQRAESRLRPYFPAELPSVVKVDGYLWARTIRCPYCAGSVPLSPNWRLDAKGTGVKLVPEADAHGQRVIRFEIVRDAREHSRGTVSDGNAECPHPDCLRRIDGDEIKRQAQAGEMGEQLYAIVYKERRKVGQTAKGKDKFKNVRDYRAPRPEDDVREQVRKALDAKLPEWEARGIVPDEEVLEGNKTEEPRRYGMRRWRDLFSPRQLFGHCTSVEVFHELVEECGGAAALPDLDRAALTYVALAIDKLLNYNAKLVRWHSKREVLTGVFDRHDYAFLWSYAEMAPAVTGLGYDWAIEQTAKALDELVELIHGESAASADGIGNLFAARSERPTVTVTNESADHLTSVADASVDLVVMDPPYGANVMYAELSDFFYVWLKRTAGLLFPEPFSAHLTDKEREAVANAARFREHARVRGTGGADRQALRDYHRRMAGIFAECRRVLRPDGLMVVMFTHKATGAWDALARGLVEAGFTITASWPIHTEAEGSLHIKDKNAARSTIFLVCRPHARAQDAQVSYWEDVEPQVARTVRAKVEEFQRSGIRGVDLYLACFGPALEVFSRHWPLQRGRPAQRPEPPRGRQLAMFEDDDWDPYAVRPEDALMAARGAVKAWRLDQLSRVRRQASLDPVTEFFVLAWDAFSSPEFPADEALKLARVVGCNFDAQLRKQVLEVKGDSVLLWDSRTRAQHGTLGAADGPVLLDVLHQAARIGREQNTGAARDFLETQGVLDNPAFHMALAAVLEVLPAPRSVTDAKSGMLSGAAEDARVLERLRKLALSAQVPAPTQLELFD